MHPNCTPILCFLFFSLSLFSQEEAIQSILGSGNNFKKICQKADDHFAQKHPNIEKYDLTIGDHRDGKYVKYMRWLNYWENTLNPDGTLGDIATFSQKKLRQSKQLNSNNINNPYDNIPWENISNREFIKLQISMGRTTSIAFHPTDSDIFYVGAAIGGIWKTEDGGNTYKALGDELPYLAVSSIVVDQENPNILYLSVGDHLWNGLPSIGVYKSTDAGITWNPTKLIFSTSQNTRIYWLSANPDDSSSILVATQAGLYKTTDGFETYTKVTNSACTQVLYKHGNSNTVYLGTNNGQFLKSTNGGDTFTLIEDFGTKTVRMALTEQEPNKVVIAHDASLKISVDSGNSFPITHALPEEDRDTQVVSINPKDANDYVTGYFELYRSTNGGSSFNQISNWQGNDNLPLVHVDMRNVYANPLEDDKLYFCHDGGIDVYNVDSGEFTNLSDGLIITQFYDIGVSQTEPNVISGGSQDNGSMYRNKSGAWNELAGTGDGMITEIDPNNSDIIYWEYQFGGMRRFNQGVNKDISPPGKGGTGLWITPFRLDPSNSNRIVVGYDSVYESLDQGDTWNTISGELANGNNLNHIAIAKTEGARIYATRSGNLYVKDINSNIWTTKNLPVSNITDIEVNPNDMNKIVITNGGYTSGAKVYTSSDAGDTWVNISNNLPNVRFGAVEYYEDIPNAMFIGSETGVYYLDDNSLEWLSYGTLPNTRINDIEIQYSDQKIRIGTYGRGVFEATINIEGCDDSSPDQDNDGICDTYDLCPNLDDNLIGTPCNDGDPFSSNETYFAASCNCGGGESNIVHCPASGTDGTGSDYIDIVEIGDIFNTSAQTSYSNFKNLSTDLQENTTYTLSMHLNFSFDLDTAYAWIDYDRNGIFEESELIEMSEFDNNHTSTATFTVPDLEDFGATTMRVRNIYGANQVADPCGNYFGEVEDYTINLKEDTTLSTVEFSNSIAITYPNPTKDIVNISIDDNKGDFQTTIYDLKGVLQKTSINEKQINLSSLSFGTYLLEITLLKSGKKTIEKIIIRR